MCKMADEIEDIEVNENWEDFVDTGVLDKKLEAMKARISPRNPDEDSTSSYEPVILQEDVPRTQYAPPQPQVKILKRPIGIGKNTEGGNALLINGEKVQKQPIKTLQQREAEYAEARLRILGAAKSEEEVVEERLAKITIAAPVDDLDVVQAPPVGSIRVIDAVQIIRPPNGPDGTDGFAIRR